MNNEATTQATDDSRLDENDIIEWLAEHPRFLQRHPSALSTQHIAHDSGSATSLIERQVDILRDSNRELQTRFNEFVAMARDNEQRVTQLNKLAKALLVAGNTAELMTGLTRCLHDDLAVDAIFLGLHGAPDTADPVDGMHTLTDDDPRHHAVADALRDGMPVCGPLSEQQTQALFTADQPGLTSAAMIPLGHQGTHAVLVLASRDPDRFVANMGTLFLELTGELVTAALQRHLGQAALP